MSPRKNFFSFVATVICLLALLGFMAADWPTAKKIARDVAARKGER